MRSQPHAPPPGVIFADRGYVKRYCGNEDDQLNWRGDTKVSPNPPGRRANKIGGQTRLGPSRRDFSIFLFFGVRPCDGLLLYMIGTRLEHTTRQPFGLHPINPFNWDVTQRLPTPITGIVTPPLTRFLYNLNGSC